MSVFVVVVIELAMSDKKHNFIPQFVKCVATRSTWTIASQLMAYMLSEKEMMVYLCNNIITTIK